MAQVRSNRPIHEVLLEVSGIFRKLSTDCLAAVCQKVKEHRFKPEEEILDASSIEDNCLCIIDNGSAELENEHVKRTLNSGMAIGEASLLGLADLAGDRGVLRALTACVVQVLYRDDFADVLADFPDEEKSFTSLVQDFSTIGSPGSREGKNLWKTLQRSAVFRGSSVDFLTMLCWHMEAIVLAPGDALFERGEECLPEESPSYLVLAGQVQIEGEAEALVWTAGAGEVLGAAGPIGPVERRGTTARAWRKGLVYCARLPGLGLELALREHPEELGPLEQIVGRLEAAEEEAIRTRQEWLRQVAVPALARTPLLTGCPDEFLWSVATTLAENSYVRGQDVVEVGGDSDSMLVVLEGAVDLISRAGAHVGSLRCEGVLGEAELLGLLCTRMVSAKAACECRVLEVTGDALRRGLEGPHGADMKKGLEVLVQSRKEQAERLVPLSALSIGAKQDLSVCTACQLAERLHFEPGQFWEPIPDSDPCGPHVGILVQGKAVITISPDDQEVMPLLPGSLVLEGQLAEFGAKVGVLSGDCEIYRMRRSELEAAARICCPKGKARSVTQEVADWFYHFRLLEKEVRARFHERLNSAKGLVAIRERHPCDGCIQDWSRRRQKSLRRAEQMRLERAETVVGAGKPPLLQLPLLPKPNMNSTEYRSWHVSPERKPLTSSRRSSSSSCKALPVLPKGLSCYPVMRLPKILSEPQLRRPASRERSGSRERAIIRV